MLYVTTRDKYDAYTAPRTLAGDTGPDGGLYLPFRMPCFDSDAILALKDKTFGQCVAEMLNQFFSIRLTGWDVEFCVGRYPVKVSTMSHRILVAELWRNLDGNYEKMERRLAAKILGCAQFEVKMTSWLRIAIRAAVLFGLFSELLRMGAVDEKHPVDIAVPAGDFSLPMAVWYGREMGLPIANIICSCNNNSAAWDLLHLGELRTSGAAGELERLIHGTLGVNEARRFSETCEMGGVYTLLPVMAEKLRRGMFSAVVSRSRLEAVIPSVYRTNSYILEPNAALAYSGLMDYRAKSGESRTALLLADQSPAEHAEMVASAMKISAEDLRKMLDLA